MTTCGSPITATVVERVVHEPGLGKFSRVGDPDPNYAMGNLIGTTEAITDDANEIVGRRVFTAFGERVFEGGTGVPPVSTRYGYAGQWWYQEASQETSN